MEKRSRKVIGWHMLGFQFLGKIKVVLGSNRTKFLRSDQPTVKEYIFGYSTYQWLPLVTAVVEQPTAHLTQLNA